MASFESQKMKALQGHWESRNCKHDGPTELRTRIVARGGTQCVEQCLRCGASTTNPMGKAKAMEANGGIEPPPFDDNLAVKWRKDGEEGAKKITGDFDTQEELRAAEFRNWYDVYLSSDEWADKKSKVMKRANHLCEGCGEAPSVTIVVRSFDTCPEGARGAQP